MTAQGVSERRALALVHMSASSLRYTPAPDTNAALRARIVTLAHRHRRYGAGMIYLYFGREPGGEVQLEILDPQGTVIRRFSSAEPEDAPEDLPDGETWQLEAAGTDRLPTDPGMHRFVWDLRYPGPWDKDPSRAGTRGPWVPPGRYEARLTVGSWSDTRAFRVRLDPRVAAAGVTASDVRAQFVLAVEARDALSDARLTVERLEAARVDGELGELEAIYDELVTKPIRYSQPMIVDQLQYLYSNLIVADQQPGRDAYERYDDLRGALDEQIRVFEQLVQ